METRFTSNQFMNNHRIGKYVDLQINGPNTGFRKTYKVIIHYGHVVLHGGRLVRALSGSSFQTLAPATENARFSIAAVRINGTIRTPSQQSKGIGYPGHPTLADRDLLGRWVPGQVGTARPERRFYTECAAGQEANDENLTYIW